MASYTAESLHIRAEDRGRAGAFAALDAKRAGWDSMNFAAVRLGAGKTFEVAIDAFEYVAVILSGRCNIHTNRGDFEGVGRRDSVFSGLPYAVYLPPHTEFAIESLSENFEFASCWAPSERESQARLISPGDIEVRLLGGGNCSRQMCRIIGGAFPADRLLVYELYTPGGNWSSYPPHKHDRHTTDERGKVLEAQLNRLSFFKFDRPTGYAYQRVYDRGQGWDALMMARQHDIVLMPQGYYTLVSAPGGAAYTLNFLAGSTRDFAYSDDPDYSWARDVVTGMDPRLPLVDLGMEIEHSR